MISGRRMFGLDKFLDHRVGKLISEYRKGRDTKLLPIDLFEIARIAGVSSIEQREMIPEAVLENGPEGFRISLQGNFCDVPGYRLRQRFSLAHEIGHTLFYESGGHPAKPLSDAPTGDQLEAACHRVAALLLLPEKFLRDEISRFADFPHAEDLIELAAKFDVSMEVLLRRLRDLGFFDKPERAPILVRGPQELIEYAVYPPWLKMFATPQRGTPFARWFGGSRVDSERWESHAKLKQTQEGRISARRVDASRSLGVYEIAIDRFSD